jgi:predicted nucleotidyltransferase
MCSRSQLEDIKNIIAAEMKRRLGGRLDDVLLYGSCARGDFDEDSDLDIRVLADVSAEEANRVEKALIPFTCGLDLEYDVVVSLYVKDRETFDRWIGVLPFYQNVAREGVRLIA